MQSSMGRSLHEQQLLDSPRQSSVHRPSGSDVAGAVADAAHCGEWLDSAIMARCSVVPFIAPSALLSVLLLPLADTLGAVQSKVTPATRRRSGRLCLPKAATPRLTDGCLPAMPFVVPSSCRLGAVHLSARIVVPTTGFHSFPKTVISRGITTLVLLWTCWKVPLFCIVQHEMSASLFWRALKLV